MLEITLEVKGQKIAISIEEARKLKTELDALFPKPVTLPLDRWVQPPLLGPGNWPYRVTCDGVQPQTVFVNAD